MSLRLTWIHHASFRIEGSSGVLYIDPWKLPAPRSDADVVFVSHMHYDHFSKADIEAISKSDTVVIAPSDVLRELGGANGVTPGDSVYIKDILVEAVAAYNIDKTFHPRSQNWCGAVFTVDDRRIYYAGDTDHVPEMADLPGVDIALLPVGGIYTMTAHEAAQACLAIRPRLAIPYHWGDIVGRDEDAQEFADSTTCPTRLLAEGETVEF